MVQQAMLYIDQTPDLDTRIELIKTLNSVSAGKVSLWFHESFTSPVNCALSSTITCSCLFLVDLC